MDCNQLIANINSRFADWVDTATIAINEVTLEVKSEYLTKLCLALRDEPAFDFKMLVDVCGLDYLHYGLDDWQTHSTTETGFGRGVTYEPITVDPAKPNRFA